MESFLLHSLLHRVGEDQGRLVLIRNYHSLGSCKATGSAGVVEALDLFVDSSHRLQLSHLVNDSCNGYVLPDRKTAYG